MLLIKKRLSATQSPPPGSKSIQIASTALVFAIRYFLKDQSASQIMNACLKEAFYLYQSGFSSSSGDTSGKSKSDPNSEKRGWAQRSVAGVSGFFTSLRQTAQTSGFLLGQLVKMRSPEFQEKSPAALFQDFESLFSASELREMREATPENLSAGEDLDFILRTIDHTLKGVTASHLPAVGGQVTSLMGHVAKGNVTLVQGALYSAGALTPLLVTPALGMAASEAAKRIQERYSLTPEDTQFYQAISLALLRVALELLPDIQATNSHIVVSHVSFSGPSKTVISDGGVFQRHGDHFEFDSHLREESDTDEDLPCDPGVTTTLKETTYSEKSHHSSGRVSGKYLVPEQLSILLIQEQPTGERKEIEVTFETSGDGNITVTSDSLEAAQHELQKRFKQDFSTVETQASVSDGDVAENPITTAALVGAATLAVTGNPPLAMVAAGMTMMTGASAQKPGGQTTMAVVMQRFLQNYPSHVASYPQFQAIMHNATSPETFTTDAEIDKLFVRRNPNFENLLSCLDLVPNLAALDDKEKQVIMQLSHFGIRYLSLHSGIIGDSNTDLYGRVLRNSGQVQPEFENPVELFEAEVLEESRTGGLMKYIFAMTPKEFFIKRPNLGGKTIVSYIVNSHHLYHLLPQMLRKVSAEDLFSNSNFHLEKAYSAVASTDPYEGLKLLYKYLPFLMNSNKEKQEIFLSFYRTTVALFQRYKHDFFSSDLLPSVDHMLDEVHRELERFPVASPAFVTESDFNNPNHPANAYQSLEALLHQITVGGLKPIEDTIGITFVRIIQLPFCIQNQQMMIFREILEKSGHSLADHQLKFFAQKMHLVQKDARFTWSQPETFSLHFAEVLRTYNRPGGPAEILGKLGPRVVIPESFTEPVEDILRLRRLFSPTSRLFEVEEAHHQATHSSDQSKKTTGLVAAGIVSLVGIVQLFLSRKKSQEAQRQGRLQQYTDSFAQTHAVLGTSCSVGRLENQAYPVIITFAPKYDLRLMRAAIVREFPQSDVSSIKGSSFSLAVPIHVTQEDPPEEWVLLEKKVERAIQAVEFEEKFPTLSQQVFSYVELVPVEEEAKADHFYAVKLTVKDLYSDSIEGQKFSRELTPGLVQSLLSDFQFDEFPEMTVTQAGQHLHIVFFPAYARHNFQALFAGMTSHIESKLRAEYKETSDFKTQKFDAEKPHRIEEAAARLSQALRPFRSECRVDNGQLNTSELEAKLRQMNVQVEGHQGERLRVRELCTQRTPYSLQAVQPLVDHYDALFNAEDQGVVLLLVRDVQTAFSDCNTQLELMTQPSQLSREDFERVEATFSSAMKRLTQGIETLQQSLQKIQDLLRNLEEALPPIQQRVKEIAQRCNAITAWASQIPNASYTIENDILTLTFPDFTDESRVSLLTQVFSDSSFHREILNAFPDSALELYPPETILLLLKNSVSLTLPADQVIVGNTLQIRLDSLPDSYAKPDWRTDFKNPLLKSTFFENARSFFSSPTTPDSMKKSLMLILKTRSKLEDLKALEAKLKKIVTTSIDQKSALLKKIQKYSACIEEIRCHLSVTLEQFMEELTEELSSPDFDEKTSSCKQRFTNVLLLGKRFGVSLAEDGIDPKSVEGLLTHLRSELAQFDPEPSKDSASSAQATEASKTLRPSRPQKRSPEQLLSEEILSALQIPTCTEPLRALLRIGLHVLDPSSLRLPHSELTTFLDSIPKGSGELAPIQKIRIFHALIHTIATLDHSCSPENNFTLAQKGLVLLATDRLLERKHVVQRQALRAAQTEAQAALKESDAAAVSTVVRSQEIELQLASLELELTAAFSLYETLLLTLTDTDTESHTESDTEITHLDTIHALMTSISKLKEELHTLAQPVEAAAAATTPEEEFYKAVHYLMDHRITFAHGTTPRKAPAMGLEEIIQIFRATPRTAQTERLLPLTAQTLVGLKVVALLVAKAEEAKHKRFRDRTPEEQCLIALRNKLCHDPGAYFVQLLLNQQ